MDAYRVAAINGIELGRPFIAMSLEHARIILDARVLREHREPSCSYRLDVLVEAEPDFWTDTTLRAAS